MARTPSLTPTECVKVYLSPMNAARVRLAAFSPLRGKAEHGAISRIVNDALDQYFKKDPACTQQKPQPDSTTSEASPSSET
jgi:hypothetical protein